jgi:hypothetical protein
MRHLIFRHTSLVGALALAAASLPLFGTAAAENCPPFPEPLESAESVIENGGTISGSVSFTPFVNGNGACFSAGESISYSDPLFNTGAGSLSFWFQKSGTDPKGGLVQIGKLGAANSLGVMFNFTTTLVVELNTPALHQISVASAVSDVDPVHIVVTWENRSDGVHVKLFRNGESKGYMLASGSFNPSTGGLDIGMADWYPSALGCIDEFAFFDWPLLDSEVYGEYVVSGNRQARQPSTRPISTGPVKILKDSLLVNGRPFIIKGVGYQPTPIGLLPDSVVYTDADILDRDIPLIRAMNANTVRLWGELTEAEILLDKLYNGGVNPIYAILSFWIHADQNLADTVARATLETEFRAFVTLFKDHPAVLAWAIGNEVNLHYTGPLLSDWYSLANDLAAAAHEIEGAAYHPTMIVNGGLMQLGDTLHGSDDVSLSHVDAWGINGYFGDDDHCYFDYYKRLSKKPMAMTEFGVDAYDQNAGALDEQAQADWDVLQWEIISKKSLGGTVMEYSDEWWKYNPPTNLDVHDSGGFIRDAMNDRFSNEEYWGIVSVSKREGQPDDVTRRLAYFALKAKWLPALSPGGLILLVALLTGVGATLARRH